MQDKINRQNGYVPDIPLSAWVAVYFGKDIGMVDFTGIFLHQVVNIYDFGVGISNTCKRQVVLTT